MYYIMGIPEAAGRLEMGGWGGCSPPNREAAGRLEMEGLGGRSPPTKGEYGLD